MCKQDPIERCSCPEMLRLSGINVLELDKVDIKSAFRRASLSYHPEQGGSDSQFRFLHFCEGLLLHKGLRKAYAAKVAGIRARQQEKGWPEERYRQSLEEYHLELMGSEKLHEWAESESNDIAYMHVFLDNTLSVKTGQWTIDATQTLRALADRLLRTPATVHVIGAKWEKYRSWGLCLPGSCRGHQIMGDGAGHCSEGCETNPNATIVDVAGPESRQLFTLDDDPSIEEIEETWNFTAKTTYLWEYVSQVLERTLPDGEHEAVIITDGHDNDSPGEFAGRRGFNEVMLRLRAAGRPLPRFSVRFLGGEDSDYQDLALGSGGTLVGGTGEQANADFGAQLVLPHGRRAAKSQAQRAKYEQLLAQGSAGALPWYQ